MISPARILIAALLVAATHAMTYLARDFQMPTETAPLQQDFHSLPLRLGTWQGQDVEVDPELFRAIGAEVTVDRLCRNPAGQTVSLHAAVFREYDIGTPHPPELCYTNNGFLLADSTEVRLPLESQPVARLLTLQRNGEVLYVLYWYQFNERTFVDRDGQRRTLLTFRGQPTRPPLIKVMMQAAAPSRQQAREVLTDLAVPVYQWTSQYR